METISIKALANKVIERNRKGNCVETESFQGGNYEADSGGARKQARRIYSNILKAFLWVAEDDHQAERLRAAKDVTEPVYTVAEARELNKLRKDDLSAVHMIKSVFPEAKVEKVVEDGCLKKAINRKAPEGR